MHHARLVRMSDPVWPRGRIRDWRPRLVDSEGSKPLWDRLFCAATCRNPQFFALDHEKTPNFREDSVVRATPNRLSTGVDGDFPHLWNEEVR